MVGIAAAEVVDVQGHHAVVDDAVEEFFKQVNVKTSDEGAGEVDVVDESGAAGEVDDNAAQGFVKRNVGMTVAADAGFAAQGLFQGLSEYDADVFDGVVVVDVQVAFAGDVEVDHAVAGDLGKHMLKEGYAGVETVLSGAVEVEAEGDLGFAGVAGDADCAASCGHMECRCGGGCLGGTLLAGGFGGCGFFFVFAVVAV